MSLYAPSNRIIKPQFEWNAKHIHGHPLSIGLVGHWLFNEGAGLKVHDISGFENHGILTSFVWTGETKWAPGKFGQALSFAGTGGGDYIIVAHSSSLNSACGVGQPRSWGYWLKYAGGGNKLITDKTNNFTARHLWSESQTTYIGGGVAEGGALRTGTLTVNKWYHIFFTYDGANSRVYTNAILADGPTAQTAPSAETYNLILMGLSVTYSSGGILDDLRIYNRALSAEEIMWLYHKPFDDLEIPIYRRRWDVAAGGALDISTKVTALCG